MIEVPDSRIWEPTSDELYMLYSGLNHTQKLQLWVRVPVEDYHLQMVMTKGYFRLRVEVPYGLVCQREYDVRISGGFEVDMEHVKFLDCEDYELLSFKLDDVTCVCVLDEE